MSKKSRFEVGDNVKIKSGGPDMTVCFVSSEGGMISAQWFAGKSLKRGTFPIESLEEAKRRPEKE
jgi:uncharacterized protein YodC (DUF2158 family)